jgi:DNA-directed RNA polymerase specialized sigma24 family protein
MTTTPFPVPPEQQPPDQQSLDERTLALLRAGDEGGVRALLAHHGGPVLAALRRTFAGFLTELELEETLAAAIVRVWMATSPAPAGATLRSWLYVIARNCGLSVLRRRRRRRHELPLDAFEDALARMSSGPAEHERLRRLADFHACLLELPPLPRAVLHADLDANGTADAEVLAERFASSVRSIYSARSRGRAEVRRMMQRLGHFVDDAGSQPAQHPTPEFG